MVPLRAFVGGAWHVRICPAAKKTPCPICGVSSLHPWQFHPSPSKWTSERRQHLRHKEGHIHQSFHVLCILEFKSCHLDHVLQITSCRFFRIWDRVHIYKANVVFCVFLDYYRTTQSTESSSTLHSLPYIMSPSIWRTVVLSTTADIFLIALSSQDFRTCHRHKKFWPLAKWCCARRTPAKAQDWYKLAWKAYMTQWISKKLRNCSHHQCLILSYCHSEVFYTQCSVISISPRLV